MRAAIQAMSVMRRSRPPRFVARSVRSRWLHRRRGGSVARLLTLPALALGLLCCVGVSAATEGPRELLERMNRALEQVPFEGTLVYLHGQEMSALRISHRISNGRSGESLLSLTGPVRSLSRHAQGVTCMLPDSAPLSVPHGHGHGGFFRAGPLDFPRLAQYYRLRDAGYFRVAGRDTRVVVVQAIDAYRYGYRFYVDEASGLPLKVDLLAPGDHVVQQVMFTEINIEPPSGDEGPAPSATAPPPAAPADTATATPGTTPTAASAVSTEAFPPGFRVVSTKTFAREDGASIDQLVASDGLASFSLYIEPPVAGALQGQSRLGAVSAAGGRVGDHHVTVVGEVPTATVQAVLDRLELPGRP